MGEEGKRNAENLPAEKAPAQEGAWLPQENGDQKRPQSSCAQKSKRQKTADLLIPVRQPVADRQHIQRILFEGMPGGNRE